MVSGDYTQTPAGILAIELGGTSPGVTHDVMQVSGVANLAGTLTSSWFGPFTGSAGDQFAVMTYASRVGNFTTFTPPAGSARSSSCRAASRRADRAFTRVSASSTSRRLAASTFSRSRKRSSRARAVPNSASSSATPTLAAIALRVRDAGQAFQHSLDLGAWEMPTRAAAMELHIPGIHGVGESLIYFVDRYRDFSIYDVDFVPLAGTEPAAEAAASCVPSLAHLRPQTSCECVSSVAT